MIQRIMLALRRHLVAWLALFVALSAAVSYAFENDLAPPDTCVGAPG
jgi:hypothetical protein